jgi:hypothetical protein
MIWTCGCADPLVFGHTCHQQIRNPCTLAAVRAELHAGADTAAETVLQLSDLFAALTQACQRLAVRSRT